jgi:hypothetical protein
MLCIVLSGICSKKGGDLNHSKKEKMKRGRVDGGISRDEYDALSENQSKEHIFGSKGIPHASDSVLKSRKILTKVSTRAHEFQRHAAALNKSFVASLKAQLQHNGKGDWSENMKEYVQYAREIECKFGSAKGKVCRAICNVDNNHCGLNNL